MAEGYKAQVSLVSISIRSCEGNQEADEKHIVNLH